jgi:hypothetical protein
MDADHWLDIVAPFYKVVGEAVEELTRRSIAEIDTDLLRLKREELTDQLEETRASVAQAANLEKKNQIADLASRGLSGATLKESFENGVDTRSTEVLKKMHREYNRAIEKIALLERKVRARQWWPWPLRWVSSFFSP